MRIGLGLNVNETPEEIADKAVEAERRGLDILWVGDLPTEAYAPIMAAVLAENTKRIMIGVGLISPLLYRARHIASMMVTLIDCYGSRFELCIGPGDPVRLAQVGVERQKEIVGKLISASKEIRERLKKFGVEVHVPLWLGAQGPQMIRASTGFDGVLLNLPSIKMSQWAIQLLKKIEVHDKFRMGVFSVSYVYKKVEDKIYLKALQAASTVARGASPRVLEKFGYEFSSSRKLPEKTLREFSIIMNQREFLGYLTSLDRIGIRDIVLAYPQNHSVDTIRDLGEAAFQYREK